jgi:hypothetical protein
MIPEKRLVQGFHATMCCVYLAVISSDLVGWYAARDAIFLIGVALWIMVFLRSWAVANTGERQDDRHRSACATHRPSGSKRVSIQLIPARQSEPCRRVQRTHSRL